MVALRTLTTKTKMIIAIRVWAEISSALDLCALRETHLFRPVFLFTNFYTAFLQLEGRSRLYTFLWSGLLVKENQI